MSKDSVVTASRVSWLVIPGRSLIECKKLESALRGIWTPLGLPVEPEV